MRVEWHKVTWYSQALSIILFVALVWAAFWMGMVYGQAVASERILQNSFLSQQAM